MAKFSQVFESSGIFVEVCATNPDEILVTLCGGSDEVTATYWQLRDIMDALRFAFSDQIGREEAERVSRRADGPAPHVGAVDVATFIAERLGGCRTHRDVERWMAVRDAFESATGIPWATLTAHLRG